MTFEEFRRTLFSHYEAAEYAAGQALLVANSAEFPQHAQPVAYWHACIASKLGQTETALDLLEAAIEAGHWFSPAMLGEDAALAPLRDVSARFEHILAASEARMMDALASSDPARIVFEPAPAPDGPMPVLFALHGNGGSAKSEAEHWDMLAEDGWLVVLPQSSQLEGPDRYVWDDAALANDELLAHFAEISAEYSLDPARIVLGGFSRGGLRALELALSGAIPATGFIGIAPTVGHSAELDPPTSSTVERGTRFAFVYGDRDRHLPAAQTLIPILQGQGLAATLTTHEGGHQYANDMPETLGHMIQFITKGS